MVGTEIWLRRRLGYRLDRGWSGVISAHWDRTGVVDAARSIPGLVLQGDEWQSPFKASWFVEASDPDAVVLQLERALADRSLEALLIHSSRTLLDAVPVESGKGSATAFLARRLRLPPDRIVTAGDSGNDLDMMRPDLGFRAIVVGNAEPAMRAIVADHVYVAGAPYAAGIAEGLDHWGWL